MVTGDGKRGKVVTNLGSPSMSEQSAANGYLSSKCWADPRLRLITVYAIETNCKELVAALFDLVFVSQDDGDEGTPEELLSQRPL